MKKLAILILVISMALSFTGASCLTNIQQILCNPPANVVAVANAAAPVIAMIINLAVPGSAAWVNANNAAAIVSAIQSRVCIGITQLNTLIAFLESSMFKQAQTKAMVGKKLVPVPLNIQPLRDWKATVK